MTDKKEPTITDRAIEYAERWDGMQTPEEKTGRYNGYFKGFMEAENSYPLTREQCWEVIELLTKLQIETHPQELDILNSRIDYFLTQLKQQTK